jgi:hypothetical protein
MQPQAQAPILLRWQVQASKTPKHSGKQVLLYMLGTSSATGAGCRSRRSAAYCQPWRTGWRTGTQPAGRPAARSRPPGRKGMGPNRAPLAGWQTQPRGVAGLTALLEEAALLADTDGQLLAPDRRAPAGGAPMHDRPCQMASDLTCVRARLGPRMQGHTWVATGALRDACSVPWTRCGRAGHAAAPALEQVTGRNCRLRPAA